MDEKYFDEGVSDIKLPKSLNCKANEILKNKGKLKLVPQGKNSMNFLNVCSKPTPSSSEFPYNANTPQSNLNYLENCKIKDKKEKNVKLFIERKVKTENELYQEEREILIADFERDVEQIIEEDADKIIKERPDYKKIFDSALKVKNELLQTLKTNLFELMMLDKGKYLKKEHQNQKKWTLVLEIQGVLECITGISDIDYDFSIPVFKGEVFLYNMYVKNRADIGEFLLTMSKFFELIIFSEIFEESLFALAKFLEQTLNIKFDYVIGSNHSFYKNSSMTIKNMECLFENRSKGHIIIIDYNLNNSCFYLDNTIIVPKFTGKEEDPNFLKYLAKFLLMKINPKSYNDKAIQDN